MLKKTLYLLLASFMAFAPLQAQAMLKAVSGGGGGGSGGTAGLANLDTVDPRNYGAQCTGGWYTITSSSLGVGGTGYAVNDTFNVNVSNSTGGTSATGHVTGVSGGVVTTYTLDTPGDVYTVQNGFGTVATSGAGTGLTINVLTTGGTGFDDTPGFAAAANAGTPIGKAVMVPGGSTAGGMSGCWISNLGGSGNTFPAGTAFVGQGWGPNYGYAYSQTTGPYTKPILHIIGHPSFGINYNGQQNIALVGFEINAFTDTSAYGVTACAGGSKGTSPSDGSKVWNFQMSFKGCHNGWYAAGLVYFVSENSDYGANDTGINGSFSDFLSLGDTFVSGTTGLAITSGNGGLIRVANARFEYLTTGVQSSAGLEVSFDNNQFDHFEKCAVLLNNANEGVTFTGGTIKAGGVGGSMTVTGAADNGSGAIRLTVTSAQSSFGGAATSQLITGDTITVSGVGGTTEANGNWTITVVDGTHLDLQASTFTHAYTSGGFGGVWGKSADVCLHDSSASRGITFDNVIFASATALGQAAAPAYVFERSTTFDDYIDIRNGVMHPLSVASASNYESYSIAPFNWESVGAPTHLTFDSQGNAPLRTDNTEMGLNGVNGANAGMSLCASAPGTNLALDMTACANAIGLPQWTTSGRPASPAAGMIGYNTTIPQMEIYINSGWFGLDAGGSYHTNTFSILGTIAAGNDQTNWIIMPTTATIIKAYAIAKTGPTGQAAIFDIQRSTNNGSSFTSLWASDPSDKIQIAGGANNGSTNTFTTTTVNAGDVLRFDIDQIGSGAAGANVTVTLVTLY